MPFLSPFDKGASYSFANPCIYPQLLGTPFSLVFILGQAFKGYEWGNRWI